MSEIKSVEDVRASAREMVETATKASEQRQALIKDFINVFGQVAPGEIDNSGLEAMLALDDSTFEMIAPIFLTELEKSINNVNDKVTLVQLLNASNITVDEIAEQYHTMLTYLDDAMPSEYSQAKKDFLKQVFSIVYNAVAETEGVPRRVIQIPIELCNADAKCPAYAHITDAGMDIYALEDITIAPGETKLIPTGIKVALPKGYELQVRPKSGRSLNTKLRIANTPGTIDSGYRDEIGVIIDNISAPIQSIKFDDTGKAINVLYGSSYTIGKGEKFAQLVLSEVVTAAFSQVESVANIGEDRGGGFGSTSLF